MNFRVDPDRPKTKPKDNYLTGTFPFDSVMFTSYAVLHKDKVPEKYRHLLTGDPDTGSTPGRFHGLMISTFVNGGDKITVVLALDGRYANKVILVS